MAIALDAKTSATGSASTLTWSHVTGSGANRLLLVETSDFDGTTNQPSGVTYNGVAMTKIAGAAQGTGFDVATLWGLKNPPSGTFNVVVTWVGTPGSQECGSQSWTGVDQTTPWGTGVTATGAGGTQPTVNVTGTLSTSIVVDSYAEGAGALTETGTLLHSAVAAGEGGGAQYKAGSGTITMNWTGATSTWAIVAAEVFAVAVAATSQPTDPMHLQQMQPILAQ